MRKLLIILGAAAALTTIAPAASYAQFAIDTPVGGVRVGEPGYRHHDGDRWERRRFREREVRGYRSRGDCRTITIQRDDGSVKRIRKCDY
jgi:hypothetical protein